MTRSSALAEMRALTALAWPVTLGSLQWMLLNFIDTTMLGTAGTTELAAINSGRILTWVAVMVGIGLISGVPVFVARAVGAGQQHHCGAYWRQAMLYALVIGLFVAVTITIVARPALEALDQPEALIEQATGYAVLIGWVFPVVFMMRASDGFLQGISRPKVGMVIGLAALPLNVMFNFMFIYGRFGLPAMGAPGAALGTLLADSVALVVMLAYLARMPDRQRYGLTGSWRGLWRASAPLRRFGYAPGLASGLELGGFAVLMALAGALGTATGAAFAAVTALHTIALSAAVGFGIAASVRIGEATGARHWADIPQRGWLAAAGAALYTGSLSLLFLAAPHAVLGLFHLRPDAFSLGLSMLVLLAPFLVFDSVQIVLLFALRACGDQVRASLIQVAGFFVLMGGVGVWAVKVEGLGAQGVIIGLIAGVVATAAALAWRFRIVSRRMVRDGALPAG